MSFRELRESDSSRIRHKRVAEADGEEVPYEEIVKGYEIAPEQYVVLTRDELEELDPKKTRAIEIQDFVDLDEIDPIYFDHPYYLGPDKGAEKAYALLVKAMADSKQGRDRPLRAAKPREPGGDPADGQGADDGDDALRRRGRLARRARRRDPRERPQDRQARGRDGQAADRVAEPRLRRRQVSRRVPRGAAGADRAQGARRGDRRGRLRGAEADQGARPDGGARGEPRRGQGRAARRRLEARRREGRRRQAAQADQPPAKSGSALQELQGQIEIAKQGQSREVDVDGHRLELTNLDKVLWPETGFTKGEVIDYYARVADAILPHLRDRPLTLRRYPERRRDASSLLREALPEAPAGLGRDRRGVERAATRATSTTASATSRPTLIWMAQLAALELHPSLSLAREIERPTVLAFDLDPGAPADILDCCRVALRLRELFGELDLECFPKTSGSKGLQVYVPLNGEVTYERDEAVRAGGRPGARARRARTGSSRGWRRSSARARSSSTGARTTSTRRRSPSTRCGRASGRPPRPRSSWEEVERRRRARRPRGARLRGRRGAGAGRERGDLFAPVLELEQELPDDLGKAA